jgi:diguanylate cyclase (GGDEF)-like protein
MRPPLEKCSQDLDLAVGCLAGCECACAFQLVVSSPLAVRYQKTAWPLGRVHLMANKTDIRTARILIVDDKDANVKLLEHLLRDAGYHNLTSTRDPTAVCALHRADRYDLILLDLQMPGMTGFEVLDGLKAIEHSGYAPVLALTVESEHKLRALAAGALDFLVKPFDMTEFNTRVRNLLEVRLLYTRLENSVDALKAKALHDPLTGLPNRRLLMERLQMARVSSARSHHHCALMFLDIDYFKQLNDTQGHDVGDLLLQQVAERALKCVRDVDSVARFGGDEFVVLLDALSSQSAEASCQAQAIAQHLLQALGCSYTLQDQSYDCTMSIGLAMFQGDDGAVGELLKMADLAMYRAKYLGRNQVCVFDPSMQAAVLAQDARANDMRRGLSAQEFVLHYQIQVNAQGLAVGAEALLRWNHPEKGQLMPADFLPLAEDSGVILPLGDWVLEAACQQLLLWAKSPATASWTLAVNISASQMAQPDFVNRVIAVLHKTSAPPERLRLELTEGTLLQDVEAVIAKMHALNAHGLGFCLDDFGAGFASLAYLKRLPLVEIKVDQLVVHGVLEDVSLAVIASAIVALGASRHLPVIAEGVETSAQHDFFVKLGCYAFQGKLFGAAALPLVMHSEYLKNRDIDPIHTV